MKASTDNISRLSTETADDIMRMFGDDNRLKARHIILHSLPNDLWFDGIGAASNHNVHVILCDTSPLFIALARQVALLSHFPNFDEATAQNRTRITFFSADNDCNSLRKAIEEYSPLGNLTHYCPVHNTIYTDNSFRSTLFSGKGSFLDIELEYASGTGSSLAEYVRQCCHANEYITCFGSDTSQSILFNGECSQFVKVDDTPISDTERHKYLAETDFTRAMLVNKVYNIGTGLREVSNFDTLNAAEYNMSLQRLCDEMTPASITESWQAISGSDETEMKLSNLFCSDSFNAKLASLDLKPTDFLTYTRKAQLISKIINPERLSKSIARQKLERHLQEMARTEHSRWNVEKLILGYQPYSPDDHYADERLTPPERAARRKRLKKHHKRHIDICSYKDLMHIDPASIKYDCLIILAIERILRLESQFKH